MSIELKRLSAEGVPRAIEKAERYRLLNEPEQAASICIDVLEVDARHHAALVTLLLAYTDQLASRSHLARRAREVVARLADPYERAYYAGVVAERASRAAAKGASPHAGMIAYAGYCEAMAHYEEAEKLRPAGNDDALLRWNTCARALNDDPSLRPAPEEGGEEPLE